MENGAGISGQGEMSMLRLGKQKRAPPLFWDEVDIAE